MTTRPPGPPSTRRASPARQAHALHPPPHNVRLSKREREVLLYLAEGDTKRAIAEQLYLSVHTVDTHVRNIYRKLHVNSGPAAVMKAIRYRLI